MVIYELVGSDGEVLNRWEPIVTPAIEAHKSVIIPITESIKAACHIQAIILTRDAELPKKQALGSTFLMHDFSKLFENRELADVTVRGSDGVALDVHKLILTTRSSVFNTMFNIDMTENATSLIEIKDFNSKVLHQLFRFMYCGEVDTNEEINLELLRAAKRYEIGCLAEICENFIIENFRGVNIWLFLEIAHKYELQKLFEVVATIFFV